MAKTKQNTLDDDLDEFVKLVTINELNGLYNFDPTTILMIISTVLPMLMKLCKDMNPDNIEAKSKSLAGRMLLAKHVRNELENEYGTVKEFAEENNISRKEARKILKDLRFAMVDAAQMKLDSMSKSNIEQLMNQVG